jgi:hypothetical protein
MLGIVYSYVIVKNIFPVVILRTYGRCLEIPERGHNTSLVPDNKNITVAVEKNVLDR